MAKKVDIPILPLNDGEKAPSPAVSKTEKKYNVNDIDLNILLKFIKPYDGSRDTINSFLTNCNNAYELASESQRHILFKYILSQLQGKAEIAASIKDFTSYDQLKDFLKTQFSQRKHYSHLISELQECRQTSVENVTQFSIKIESILSQLLTEISMNPTKKLEIPGRTAAMEDLALHHFLMGLHPRISNIVRCRSPKNLNEAISLAISEEKIQKTLYKKAECFEKPNKVNKFTNSNSFQRNNYFNNIPRQVDQNRSSNPLQRYSYSAPNTFTPRPPQGQGQINQNNRPTDNFRPHFRNKNPSNFNRPRINFVEDNPSYYEEEGTSFPYEETYEPVEDKPNEDIDYDCQQPTLNE